MQVAAHVFDGLGIVLADLKARVSLAMSLLRKTAWISFSGLGLSWSMLQVAHLAERVLDEVLHRLIQTGCRGPWP